MKKAVIAIFSISLTAGTIYLTYTQVKGRLINKLVSSWNQAFITDRRELKPEAQSMLKTELEKLFIWEVKLLAAYSDKVLSRAPEQEKKALLKKLIDKQITSKINLQPLEGLLPLA